MREEKHLWSFFLHFLLTLGFNLMRQIKNTGQKIPIEIYTSDIYEF